MKKPNILSTAQVSTKVVIKLSRQDHAPQEGLQVAGWTSKPVISVEVGRRRTYTGQRGGSQIP